MKKFKVMIALLSSMTLLSCNFSTCLQASAVMRYYSDSIVSSENILISATDVVRVISENETYLSFANLTGKGRILCLSNRPDSDEELISAITGLNNNTRYCYIEEENCILHYNYNTKNIETTEYDTAVKYTIDLINGVIISEETGEEVSKFTTGSSYFVYDSENPDAKGEYPVYEMINYGEAGILSPLASVSKINYGNFNEDNIVDLTDLTELSLYLLGDKEFADTQILAADVNADGNVNIADLAYLRLYLNGTEDLKLGR